MKSIITIVFPLSLPDLLEIPVEQRVVLLLHPEFHGFLEEREGGLAVLDLGAEFFAELDGHAEVFVEVVDAGFGVPFLGEDVFGKADLGGVAARVGDVEDLDHVGEVDAGALGHPAALDGGHEDGVADHVVNQFQGVARAGGAEVEDFRGEGGEVAPGAAEGFFVAAEHEGEGSRRRPCGPARHAGVKIAHAFFGGAGGEALGVGRVRGGEVVEGEAFSGVREDAGGAF